MEVKYQFQEKNGNKCFFDKKNDFLEFCQQKWNESQKSKKTSDSRYSFDYGKNWYSLSNFNINRQTIQNEKKITKIDLNGKFYFLRNNEQVGPFSLDEILKRKITNKTYVWTNGMVNWEMIENIPAIYEKYNLSYRNKTNQNKDKLDSKNLNLNNEGNNSNWFIYLLLLAIIVGGYYFYNSTKSDIINDKEYTYPDESNRNQESEKYEEPNQNYEYTQEAKDIINNSPIIKVLNLDNNTINTLLSILSDPNPDPENRLGEFCYDTSTRCLYCNNLVPGEIYTYRAYFSNFLNCDGLNAYNPQCLAAITALSITTYKNNEVEVKSSGTNEEQLNSIDLKDIFLNAPSEWANNFKPVIENACSNFNSGIKTVCVENPISDGSRKFCSVKCKTEHKLSYY